MLASSVAGGSSTATTFLALTGPYSSISRILAFARVGPLINVNPFAVLKHLYGRGWVTSAVTEPAGLHLMLSPVHKSVANTYLADLAWATQMARDDGARPAEARYGG